MGLVPLKRPLPKDQLQGQSNTNDVGTDMSPKRTPTWLNTIGEEMKSKGREKKDTLALVKKNWEEARKRFLQAESAMLTLCGKCHKLGLDGDVVVRACHVDQLLGKEIDCVSYL